MTVMSPPPLSSVSVSEALLSTCTVDTLAIALYVKIDDEWKGMTRLPGRPPTLSHSDQPTAHLGPDKERRSQRQQASPEYHARPEDSRRCPLGRIRAKRSSHRRLRNGLMPKPSPLLNRKSNPSLPSDCTSSIWVSGTRRNTTHAHLIVTVPTAWSSTTEQGTSSAATAVAATRVTTGSRNTRGKKNQMRT